MRRTTSSLCSNISIKLSLFGTDVGSILKYRCEIWGVHKSPIIEKVHLDYCKMFLSVKKNSYVIVYFELGRFSLQYERNFRILKFWFKIVYSDKRGMKYTRGTVNYISSFC